MRLARGLNRRGQTMRPPSRLAHGEPLPSREPLVVSPLPRPNKVRVSIVPDGCALALRRCEGRSTVLRAGHSAHCASRPCDRARHRTCAALRSVALCWRGLSWLARRQLRPQQWHSRHPQPVQPFSSDRPAKGAARRLRPFSCSSALAIRWPCRAGEWPVVLASPSPLPAATMRYFARNNGTPAIRNLRYLNVLNSHHLFAPRAKPLHCQQALLK